MRSSSRLLVLILMRLTLDLCLNEIIQINIYSKSNPTEVPKYSHRHFLSIDPTPGIPSDQLSEKGLVFWKVKLISVRDIPAHNNQFNLQLQHRPSTKSY